MNSLPFAEVKYPWASGHRDDDVLVNDLDEFPPLYLPGHHLPASPSSSPASSKHQEMHDWELIRGLSFSPKQPVSEDGEDVWEDVHYSTTVPHKSFAEIAESAGMDDVPIPHERFMHWPKHSHHRRRQRHSAQSSDDNFAYTFSDEDSFEAIFDHTKSRPRISARRVPFIHRRKQRLCAVVFRREIRSLTSTSDKHCDSRIMTEQDLSNVETQLRENSKKLCTVLTLATLKDSSIRRVMLLDFVVQELQERGLLRISARKRSKHWDAHPIAIKRVAKSGFPNTNRWTAIYNYLDSKFREDKERLMKEKELIEAQLQPGEARSIDRLRPVFKKMSKRGLIPHKQNLRRECVEDLVRHLKHSDRELLSGK